MKRTFSVGAPGTGVQPEQAWLRDPGQAVAPKQAATVMFLREGAGGLEVFMLHRVPTMAFAPSTHVFPGGVVDACDAAADLPWAGPSPAEWAALMQTDADAARALVAAAVREVFEETGVLLAGPTPDTVVRDMGGPRWRAARDALLSRETSLAELLIAEGLMLRSDLLSYRAHWTTPTFEPRRYDTRFFAARLPSGQTADHETSEAQHGGWVRPADLLEQWRAGFDQMLPPTVVCLEHVAAAESVDGFLAEHPPVHEVLPVLRDSPEGLVLEMDLP